MNKLIYRKLTLDIVTFFILSSIAITSIVWVIQAVNLLDIVSEQGHGIKVYFFYTFLNLPKIFSKLLIFIYFLTLFVVLSKYEENNELIVFWTNGIKKISFINFIGFISIFFVLMQLLFTILIVPYTQNLKQDYLKTSSIDFFPRLIQEKRFSNLTKSLTIFVEKNKENGIYEGIFIKEKINETESKIIIAKKGRLIKNNGAFVFKLLDGKIINTNLTGSINLSFKETTYEISNLSSKIRQINKINETKSSTLIQCLEKYLLNRKNEKVRCEKENSFAIKDIYEEIFKRSINPIYIIILSLISSLTIIKPKINFLESYHKFILFVTGFIIILFSELGYKFLTFSFLIEIFFILLPIIFIFFFYFFILLLTGFNVRRL